MSDSPSTPPAPDYTGAANATAAGNLEAARVGAKANRVSQYTPYGNLVYTNNINGDPDLWRSDVTLSPTGQKLLDNQNNISIGLGNLTGTALDRVGTGLSQPFDYGSVQDVQDAAYKAQTDRLDPQWNTREAAQKTQLANQGLLPGSEAYATAMRDFNQGRNDAYSQARLSAINTAPTTMQLATALRNQPLNELNALRTGSQVTNPSFQQAPQQQTTAGANYNGAVSAQGQYDQGLYNAQVGAQNAQNQALGTLGSAALTAFL